MSLNRLDIHQFRNIDQVHLSCHPHFNFIVGDNGSGKTSLLESIYYLAHARSFRASKSSELIKHHNTAFNLHAEVSSGEEIIPIGISKPQRGKAKLKKHGEQIASIAELSYLLPVKLITAMAYKLILDGPKTRRAYLDWGVFHVKHHFFQAWKTYSHALQQRNALLKQGAGIKQLNYWDETLITSGNSITQMRKEYLGDLCAVFNTLSKKLLNLPDLYRITLFQGWPEEESLQQTLERNQYRDQKQGFTQAGPHRSDLLISFDQDIAQGVLSQGQLKMLSYTLHLCQGHLFHQKLAKSPIYLIDDICSDLDHENQEKVFSVITSMDAQLFITAIDPKVLPTNLLESGSMFHVKHGEIAIEAITS